MLFKFHAFVLVALLALLSSCAMMAAMEDTAMKAAELVVTAENTLDEAKMTYAQAKVESDTDGDGSTSVEEWLAWLVGAGGLGGIGGRMLAKGAVRNAQSDGRKDRIEDRINALEKPSA